MNRRSFLNILSLSIFVGPLANAFTLPRIYGTNTDPQFIQNYYKRLLKWFSAQWPSQLATLSANEKTFLQQWTHTVSDWGYSLSEQQLFENMSFSIGCKQNQLLAPTLFVGLTHWPEALKTQAHVIIKSRARTLSSKELSHLYGISWNFETHTFAIHFLYPNAQSLNSNIVLQEKLKGFSTPLWFEPCQHIETFSENKKKQDDQLQLALKNNNYQLFPKNVPIDVRAAQQFVSLHQTRYWKWYVRSFYLPLVDPKIHPLIQTLRTEFHLSPQSLEWTDAKNFRIFYP